MSNLVHNEKVKLFATFFNNLAIAIFIASALAPLFQIVYAGHGREIPNWTVIGIIAAGGIAAIAFHCIARYQLNDLKE
jgi:predicted membrane channel-forming protein YqfA (hemolysin III family)